MRVSVEEEACNRLNVKTVMYYITKSWLMQTANGILSARTCGWHVTIGYCPMGTRLACFAGAKYFSLGRHHSHYHPQTVTTSTPTYGLQYGERGRGDHFATPRAASGCGISGTHVTSDRLQEPALAHFQIVRKLSAFGNPYGNVIRSKYHQRPGSSSTASSSAMPPQSSPICWARISLKVEILGLAYRRR